MRQLIFVSCTFFFILSLFACNNRESDVSLVVGDLNIKVIDDVVVYDNGTHAAFTSLIKYNNYYYLAFREGTAHRPITKKEYGKIRILKLKNNKWESIAILSDNDKDLRDPYLLIEGNKLVVYCGYNQIKDSIYSHSGTAYCVFQEDAINSFSDIKHDAPHVIWLWKIRKHKDSYYGIGYLETEKPRLMKSVDGISWKTISIIPLDNCSEADLLFKADSLFMCIRQEGVGSFSFFGKSYYPFVETKWLMMDVSVASPELYSLPNNQILLAGREYSLMKGNQLDSINVSLFTLTTSGKAERLNVFDTGRIGDKGYPSFCMFNDNEVFMSYYVGTSNRSIIRLASIKLEPCFSR